MNGIQRVSAQLKAATGMEKLALLATHIDLLHDRVEALGGQRSLDEQLEVLELDRLAGEFGTTEETMRRQIGEVLGPSAILKVGKKRVVRKARFLEFMERKETARED